MALLPPVSDLDVSGAVSPFARTGLGPWLTHPDKIAQYDAFCACGAPVYSNTVTSAPNKDGTRRVYRKYRCSADCGEPQVHQADLDPAVADMLLTAYGAEDVPERVDIPASDSTVRLAEVTALVTGLDAEYRAGRLPAAVYARQVTALEVERADLEARPVMHAHTEWRSSGEQFAARWDRLDVPARNRLLRDLDARVVWGGAAEGDAYLVANLRPLDDLRRAMDQSHQCAGSGHG